MNELKEYFQVIVLGELLFLERFLPDCSECHQTKATGFNNMCDECYLDSLPLCAECGYEPAMGDYTEMCADCYWEDDKRRKYERRRRLYADPEALAHWRKSCADALGVPYTPIAEQDRLDMLAKYSSY